MLPKHGANPQLLFQNLKIPMPEQMVDFSENVNFASIPFSIRENWAKMLPLIEKYPDPKGEPFLSAIANYHKMPKSRVFVGNGAAEIFSLLANIWRDRQAIIVHPTFSEYEATLQAQGIQICHLEVTDIIDWSLPMDAIKLHMKRSKVIYLCTPNNPTGVLPPRKQLQQIARWGEIYQCYVVLDEAFIDWIDENQTFIQEAAENPFLIVIRSMTKMYSLAGIRLGYVVASEQIIQRLEELTAHWHINAIAAYLGVQCLEEKEYVSASIMYATEMREKYEAILQRLGCKTTNSQTNYICFQLPEPTKSRDFYLDMLLKGIVLRHTENYRGLNGEWFRLGIKTMDQMAFFEEELKIWLQQHHGS